MKPHRIYRLLAFSLVAALFLGCAAHEPLTSFFVLGGRGRNSESFHGSGATVYVRRVEVPAYLAKTNLVTMKGGIQVGYSNDARWAEPLDQGISRAVSDYLSRRGGLRAYSFSPQAPPPPYDYEVRIRIERFEGNDNGEVTLQARWEVTTSDSSEAVASRKVSLRRSGWRPEDYPGLVRLLSEEVDVMSRGIASSIPH